MQQNTNLEISDADISAGVRKSLHEGELADEASARVCLGALSILDRGETETARLYLAWSVGAYVLQYGTNGDSELLEAIKASVSTNEAVALAVTNLEATRQKMKESRRRGTYGNKGVTHARQNWPAQPPQPADPASAPRSTITPVVRGRCCGTLKSILPP